MTWRRVLDEIEVGLDDLEHRLDRDDWDDAATAASPAPARQTHPAGAVERARAEALLARVALTARRLEAEQAAARSLLDDIGRRRLAADRYRDAGA